MKLLHIFMAGTHRSMSGQELTFSEADLTASADAYDPGLHEAPLVVGHPKHNEPAFGHVAQLRADGTDLFASVQQVNPDFAEMVQKGSFKKISAAFYSPHSPGNPTPGVYYLRHVGFLGAMPPAIKGLKPVEFSEDEEDVLTIEFGEGDFSEHDFGEANRLARLTAVFMRGVREFFIEQNGLESANRATPPWLIDEATELSADENHTAFGEDDPARVRVKDGHDVNFDKPTEIMTDKEKQQAADKSAEFAEKEEELSTKEAHLKALEEKLAKQDREAKRKQHAEFVESLVKDGARVLPVHKDTVVEALMQLGAADGVTVEFGEGDDAEGKPLAEAFTEFLKGLPKNVEFGELSKGRGDRTDGEQPEDQAKKIAEFVDEQRQKGRTISFAEAQAELKKAS